MARSAMRSAVMLASVAAFGGPASLRPQEPPQTFPTTVELVVLDMVVRDKAGRVVADLRQDEVEVLEDGQPCRIDSFRLVQAGVEATARPPTTTAPASSATPGSSTAPGRTASAIREPLVFLVFDRLSGEGAAAARSAATELMKRPFPSGTWVAVLEVGKGLRMTASLTQDLGRVPAAIVRDYGRRRP